ncbi:hypothetical protein FEM48_Zijuj02G0039700 [Ziziphus jujuba var. spinosa]|uniref:Chromatin assembly factor 1 subunit FAS1 n=1 Tax=Ziziphus jujuba var. spinosa TaxID=714518 RepID=A0A978VTH5_ZIZJJ|nr:hypothetical protein FEM48_Zijuj02G0039700 [Ziziphus jujuba var. spinosa]
MVEIIAGADPNDQEMNGQDRPKKTQKRKRASLDLESLGTEEKLAQIEALRKELDGLFEYYKELMDQKVGLDLKLCGGSVNAVVASLMEEKGLPLSKLVDKIYEEVKGNGVCGSVTMASVKNTVLLVGQRIMYGLSNADADLLEDDSKSCLWCWEARDLKLMPESARGILNIRRTCRKKIHERITAVSEMIMALQKLESDQNFKHDLIKASEKLSKVLCESKIRLLVNGLLQKNGTNLAQKEAKREEKLLIKQLEKDKREAEKEKRKLERVLLKEKCQSEKELKRQQEEAEKDERRREKEESEMRKQLRKQQEEAERDQKRREKEEAEIKRQLSIQKQASIMERFLKRSKTSPSQKDQSSTKATIPDSPSKKSENMPEAVTLSMDCTLSSSIDINIEDIRKSHVSSWRLLGHSIHPNRNQHWGKRQKPKTNLFVELKLTTSRIVHDDELSAGKFADGLEEQTSDEISCQTSANCSDVQKFKRGKQLLQFDKSHRPAFYGTWPKKSHVVGPRHPLRKDPDLDYEIESDEEWEEEDPGESLSDCDKDDEEEILEGCSKADDEDESEDGFFVPDGYLSENEGVEIDRMETDIRVDEANSSSGCQQDLESEEFSALLRQQKYLNNLTEHALRKGQPLIILNLLHEKDSLLNAEDLAGTSRMEQMCLQALSMRMFPGGPPTEISLDNEQDHDREACLSSGKSCITPVSTPTAIPDSDLPTIVSAIQSCSQGIQKVVESLQQKLPGISKTQLRNKVREISDFVDNRWQVKKEILDKLGMSASPENSSRRTKSIATFFSKRCLPPTGKSINQNESSRETHL